MNIEEAIEILQEEHDYCQELSYVIKALEMAIAALRTQQEAEKNEPLTLDEYEVTEMCPHCENEITMIWDVQNNGYKAYCPVCGERLMLCDECQHRGAYGSGCDYNSETDTCKYNRHKTIDWISVKDRMPKEWITVLVWTDHGLCQTAAWIGIPGKWRVTWNHDMIEDSVTHWMPLSKPPKGEKNVMRKNLGICRGKRKDNGRWVVGYLSARTICTSNDAHLGYVIQIPPAALYNNEWYEVEKESIGEFTGKADKNSKSIFEGDILRYYTDDGYTSLYLVVWENSGWKIKWLHDGKSFDDLDDYFCNRCEVEGNVFDNPELIKPEHSINT